METIYGCHSVEAVFLTRPHAIRRVILLAGKKSHLNEKYIKLARAAKINPEILRWKEFLRTTKLTEEEKHQGVCIFAEPRTIYAENDLEILREDRVILALDQISNPRNLGTIIRSAAFFGVGGVILLKDNSAEITPMVTRVASGGAELVKIFRVINLARSLDTLKKLGFWVYGLDERGEKTLAETNFDEKTVFVVGAEGQGLRLRTRKFCDALVRIPGGRPGIESLNAGVAAAVALAELFRKTKEPSGCSNPASNKM
jgi:23S rRNA (guanosine2251-2'-O)-methyltransferase